MTHFSSWIFITLVLLMEESTNLSAENDFKYVCTGDFIQLFRNITINSTDMVVRLYIHAWRNRLIAMWALAGAKITDGYSMKVFHDKYGDIWIRNVSLSDEVQYILEVQNGMSFVTKTVHLGVRTAPTLNCKPKIKRIADVLVASLEAKECGNPPAYVDWLNFHGNHSEGKESVMLPEENHDCTYYACIAGPALMCARTFKPSDYCTAFKVEGEHGIKEINTVPQRESTMSTFLWAMLICNIGIFVLLLVLFLRKNTNTYLCCDLKTTAKRVKKWYSAVPTNTQASGTRFRLNQMNKRKDYRKTV